MPKKIDRTRKIINLHSKGANCVEIAKVCDCSRSTVFNTLKKFKQTFKNLDYVEDYQKVKADLFNSAEMTILNSMVEDEKIKKATLNQSAYALQVLHNAGRLERGQATTITASYSKVVSEDVTNARTIDVSADSDDKTF